MITTKDTLKKLKLSKYAFARLVGVSWNTVYFWERGIWKPNIKNQKKIEDLYNQK